MITYVPFILAIGPLSGYVLGDYLVKRWKFSSAVSIICIVIGFAAGIQESIRMIRLAIKSDQK